MKNIDKIIKTSKKKQNKFHKALVELYYTKTTKKKLKKAIAYHIWLKEYLVKGKLVINNGALFKNDSTLQNTPPLG